MQGVGLRLLAYYDRGFASHREHGCLSIVCVVCCQLITRPEESYRLWRVVVCDHETLWYEEAIARAGLQSQINKQTKYLCTFMKNKILLLLIGTGN
jgi:hypothetical protein